MPTTYPQTALDIHNAQVRAAKAASADLSKSSSGAHPRYDVCDPRDRLERLAFAVASERYGMTVYFGGSENAAAMGISVLEGYYATINAQHHVRIDRVDLDSCIMLGRHVKPGSGVSAGDLPFEINLNKIKTISV